MNNEFTWSKTEKGIATRAFDAARDREYQVLADEVKAMADALTVDPYDVWKIRDFLKEKSKEFDSKYDYRYSQLIFVFGRLLGEGLLKKEELAGLAEDKVARISEIANMWQRPQSE